MFLLEKVQKMHLYTHNQDIPVKNTPIELEQRSSPSYTSFSRKQKQASTKHLNKLYIYNITTLQQIQNPTTNQILTLKNSRQDTTLRQNLARKLQRNVLRKVTTVSLCYPWNIFVNTDDRIPVWKDDYSQEILELKNELTYPFVDILLYIVTSYYFDRKLPIFLWSFFLTSKCTSFSRGDHTPLCFIITCDKSLLPCIICHEQF